MLGGGLKSAVDSIAHLIQPDCQIFPNAPVYHPDTNDRVDGFSIINPWRKQRLLPEGAGGKDMTIMELRVDHTVVDKNLHIFHPAESEELIVVSEELVKAIRKNKLVGFDFRLCSHMPKACSAPLRLEFKPQVF